MPLGPRYLCPAPLDPASLREAQRLAFEAFRAIGACDLSRVDMRIDAATGQIYLLEINTLPGLNPEVSDMVLNARADGMAYDLLIHRILEAACRRYGLALEPAAAPAFRPLG
ncbi:MAG: D-alanine--D-alanine ligase, partial [Thermoflexus sp.]